MSSKNHSKLNMFIVLAVSLVFLAAIAPGTIKADVIYVDADAVGKNNGSSWANAYTSLEETLTCHANGLVGHEVWVAAGTYTAKGTCCGIACEIIPRVASFRLINGVAIYGGFAGTEDPASFDLADRDFEANETILSGDLGHLGLISDNSYHVVNGSGTDATAILDGFTITGGYADGSEVGGWNVGAGMYNSTGSPTVVNCKFSENRAIAAGGGMYNNNAGPTVVNCAFTANSSVSSTGGGMFNVNNSSPILTGCTFSNNSSAANGGGICNVNNSNPTVTDCSFIDNAGGWGGGMSNYASHPTLSNCTFIGNSAKANGGAIINNASGMTAENCMFMRNSAAQNGGGLYVIGGSPVLVNNIVSENSAGIEGGGIYLEESCYILVNNTIASNIGGGIYEVSSGTKCMLVYGRSVTNCILWGNSGYDLAGVAAFDELVPTYSDIGVGFVEGKGNISADPMFVNPSSGDYHLKASSPCVDAGNNGAYALPATDFDGNQRVRDGDGDGEAAIDMGAFEAIAGSTPSGTDVVVQPEDPATGETPVTLTFGDVTEGGVTTVNSTTPSAEQGAPEGFKFGNPPSGCPR